MQNGHGVFTTTNGLYYKGEFIDGLKERFGFEKLPNGTIY